EYPFHEEEFRNELSKHGDSLLVVSDDDVVKVHIHAEYPGSVLTLGQQYGSLINMKIENMREQHTAIVGGNENTKAEQKGKYAIVNVAMGNGFKNLFDSIEVYVFIDGDKIINYRTLDIMDVCII